MDIDALERALAKDADQHLEFLAKKDLVADILRLRDEKNVLILGHNYMAPIIYHLSPRHARGDSLALSRVAAETDHPIILFDGVRFMAETAKILNPRKKVLIADLDAGCSLADPFSPDDVERFKKLYPGAPVVTYINSYADIKAVSDYCCTSANGERVVRDAAQDFAVDKVIFFPDSLMGANIQEELKETGIEVLYPGKATGDGTRGACEVHEQFTPEHIIDIRAQHDIPKGAENGAVLAHWECSREVVAEADFCGSTSEMARYISAHPKLEKVFLATECEMAANLALEYPAVTFVRTCSLFCQHMRKITLEKIHKSLADEVYEISVDEATAQKAKRAIERMLAI